MTMTLDLNQVLKANPLMALATVTYTYTYLSGSDCCWSSTETSTCTLREWLSGVSHSGNRSFDFSFKSIEEVSNEVLIERRMAVLKLQDELNKKAHEKARLAHEKAQAFKDRIASWMGLSVTVKGKSGTVEKAMASQFKEDTVAVLVAFVDGTKKWHSEGAVKRV